MKREAIILAGGLGTRLKEIVSDVPKPMAKVNEQPFLFYLLRFLKFYEFHKVVLAVGYGKEVIIDSLGEKFLGMSINYSVEESLLGTGGGLKQALQFCEEENVLVLNGDSFFDIDLLELYEFHKNHEADLSLSLRKVEDASRYGTLLINNDCRILSFQEKKNTKDQGLINAGIYLLNKNSFLRNCPVEKSFSLEKDFFEPMTTELKMFGKVFSSYFIDIGIPEDYKKAQNDFKGFRY